jgi:hypothetical protein
VRIWEHFLRGMGESARTNGLAYGYTVALTGAYVVLQAGAGVPHVRDAFLFGLGASITFAFAGAFVTRGFRQRVDREPPVVVALGSALGILSISAATGSCALLTAVVGGSLAWFLGPLVASSVYLLVSALELLLARGAHEVAGTDDIDER